MPASTPPAPPPELLLRTSPHRLTRLAACLALLGAGTACRDPLSGFGTGFRAHTSAEQLFGAFADRYLEIARNPKYEYSRDKLARGALAPSRVYDDTLAWTSESGPVRTLEMFGSSSDGHYHMVTRRGSPAPVHPADARHVVSLTRLSDNEYRWDVAVDFAIGSIRPADASAVITRLLSAGEGRNEHEVRAELAQLAPRSSAALGTVFTLDTLRPVPLNDGSTVLTLVSTVHSEVLRRKFPSYADYVRKYVEPARYRVMLSDRAGAVYLDATSKDRVLTVRLRSQHGRLVPLSGPPRPIPDTLVLTMDLKMKVKMFTVGFHELQMEFVSSARGDHERAWTVTAHKEPEWDLPFIAARLLHAPLRRPFMGEGAMYRIGVRDGEGPAPTLLSRSSRLFVQESAILRFLNGLGNTAVDDFGRETERERNLWLRELFLALREDAKAGL